MFGYLIRKQPEESGGLSGKETEGQKILSDFMSLIAVFVLSPLH